MISKSAATESRSRKKFVKLLRLAAVAAVLFVVLGVVGFFFFQTWRARDLAAKSLENLQNENYRMAWLQLNSARALRGNDVQVLRAGAKIESRFGLPTAMDCWQKLDGKADLTSDELKERARTAARFGTKEQFDTATAALENAGLQVEATQLRAARYMFRGNMDAAIEETGRTVDALNDPASKLDYARLLLMRHMDRLSNPQDSQTALIADKISAIIDSLAGTAQEKQALALGLAFLQPPDEKRSQWADRAFKDLSSDNPALLAAASVAVQTGRAKPEELYRQMRPVFDAAPLGRRAAFALWLTRNRMPAEALTLITAQEAAESGEAFAARIEALAAMQNWNAVIETSSVEGKAPNSVRFASRARAELALGYAQSGSGSAADAVRAAAKEGDMQPVIISMDAIGAQAAVDGVIVELCGEPSYADTAFRIARERFTRREPSGGQLLALAMERTSASSPQSPSLNDYLRFKALVREAAQQSSGKKSSSQPAFSLEDAANAVEASPSDPAARITYGLALVQAGRGKEALKLFDDFTVYFNRLPPPMQASLAAIAAAGGESQAAAEMARRVNLAVLSPDERAMVANLPFP